MALESEVVFQGLLSRYGLSTKAAKFKARGWVTLSDFGYASSYVPGTTDEAVLEKDVFKHIVDDTANDILVPKIRRLYYEANLMCATDATRKITRNEDDSKPIKLPVEEFLDRINKVKAKVSFSRRSMAKEAKVRKVIM